MRKNDYFVDLKGFKNRPASRETSSHFLGSRDNLKKFNGSPARGATVQKEARSWSIINRFGEGECIGSLFVHSKELTAGRLFAESGCCVAIIRKSQVFKILANFNQSTGIQAKSVFLASVSSQFGSTSTRDREYLFSCFRVI